MPSHTEEERQKRKAEKTRKVSEGTFDVPARGRSLAQRLRDRPRDLEAEIDRETGLSDRKKMPF